MPGGERSLWVHWEAPAAPVAAYILEWQRVSSESDHCSACWQMERDGDATAALIQGKPGSCWGSLPSWSALQDGGGVAGDGHPSCTHIQGSQPGCPRPSPAPSLLHTLPACSGYSMGQAGWCHGAGAGQPGALGSQSPEPLAPPLLSIADGIEPFQRYNISVYPLYKDAIGVPVHTAAYSKQKGTCAPSSHPRGPGGLTPHHQAFAFQKGEPALPLHTPNSGAVQKSSAHWAGSWPISEGALSWTEPQGGTA